MTSDIQTIARGDASRILEARRVVARDAGQWTAIWAAHAGPDTEAPPVDFDARMVAAVFQGQQHTAGFDLAIVSARTEGRVLIVEVDEHLPTKGRAPARVVVSPFHIVSMPRVEGEVRFVDALHHANAVTEAAPAVVVVRPAKAPPGEASASSTGLTPEMAGALAYLAGPLSGALLLIVERTSRPVRFHAWQALIGLGALGVLAFLCLGLAFLMLIVSPRVFSVLLWAAAIAGVAWLGLWGLCLVQAYKGRQWQMPLVGARAARLAGAGSRS